MGGRGASFLRNISQSTENLNTVDFELYEDDKPISEDLMPVEIKQLKDNNVIVYESMLTLPQKILDEQIIALNDRVKKSDKLFTFVDENNPVEIRLAKFGNKRTKACYSMDADFTNLKILFNDSLKKETPSMIDKMVKDAQKVNWWVKCDDNKTLRLVATHEYGHFIQYNLIKKAIDRRHKKEYAELLNNYRNNSSNENYQAIRKLFDKIAFRINNKIALLSKEKYGTMNLDDVGDYGKKNQAEWFAEVYANMSLSSEPTNMAKAMKIYLKDGK